MSPLKMIFPVLLIPLSSFAGDTPDPFEGMTQSMTYPKVQVTHYSATPKGGKQCRLEHGMGGKDESPSGLRPSQHRLDNPGLHYGRPTVLAAVPQKKGSAGLLGCFFSLPDAHPGVLFYAGDWYGSGSNGKIKADVSSPCTNIVNITQYSRLIAYNCPGKKGGQAPPVAREPGSEKPPEEKPPEEKPPVKPPEEKPPEEKPPTQSGQCNWYAMLLCNKDRDETVSDAARIGSGISILNTSDFTNVNGGWYCAAIPASSQADASAKASRYRSRARGAYPLKGCQ